MAKTITVEDLLPVGMTAREIGLSENYIRRLCDAGLLPSMKDASGRRLVARDVAREFASRRKAEKSHGLEATK